MTCCNPPIIIPARPNGNCKTNSVAFNTTVSTEWKNGPMMNNPRTLITKNVKNGVTNKSNASGTFVRNHFSNLAPIIPTKNAGNTVPW